MPLSNEDYATFKQLIDVEDHKNEVACGKFLRYAAEILCPRTPRAVIDVIQEDRTHYGDSDCIVIADLDNGRGKTERFAVIWEVKAPQCPLMDFDGNAKRCTPSKDLLKAENQLIHYAHELQGNNGFRERHSIVFADNIMLGGIIIGRDGKLSSDRNEPKSEYYADISLSIRDRYIYSKTKFFVWTWDEVARFLQPS